MQTLPSKSAKLKAAQKARQEEAAKYSEILDGISDSGMNAFRSLSPQLKAIRKARRTVSLATVPAVQSVRDFREGMSKFLATIQKDPHQASPVFFGQHRKPQAVVLSYEVYEDLLAELEDAQLALQVKEILDAGGSESYEDIMSSIDLGPDA